MPYSLDSGLICAIFGRQDGESYVGQWKHDKKNGMGTYVPTPKPYTLHLTPCTIHPTPYTLHPKP